MRQSGTREPIVIAATFSVDPAASALGFWSGLIGEPLPFEISPYAQVYQQLHDPTSALRRTETPACVLCLRWSDLAGAAAAGKETVHEFAAAVVGAGLTAPCLILVCPEDPVAQRLDEKPRVLTSLLRDALSKTAGVASEITIVDMADAFAHYDCQNPYDAVADRIGHVPYTDDAFAIIATTIARWRLAATRAPIKMIAVDCDNTLWGGVVGEDGVDGVTIDAPHITLQESLKQQAACGRIVSLVSKNEDADVMSVFAQRRDMALSLDDVGGRRVNWTAKADNIAALADAFNIGVDSVLFLDDSGVECAEMRARRPEVSTVRAPLAGETDAVGFFDHLWLFDHGPATDEDKNRTRMYQQAAARDAERRKVGSLAAFIESLELEIDIAEATPANLPRLAQLTQRTNQFNASLLRLGETDLAASLAEPGVSLFSIAVRDRFGDYGTVGQIRAREEGDRLHIDLFTLSCRALGRGVEYKIINHLGEAALARGKNIVSIDFVKGRRNEPAARFLATAFGHDGNLDQSTTLTAKSKDLATLRFNAGAADENVDDERESDNADTTTVRGVHAEGATPASVAEVYERIASELTTASAITAAMRAETRDRPDLAVGYVAPARGLEREIASLWEDVLRVRPIGAHDAFADLGGKSIDLVRIHGALRGRLGLDIDLASLFQFATVAKLATRLTATSAAQNPTVERAAKMRVARRGFKDRATVFAEIRR